MNIKGVIYQSASGHVKRYAEMLGQQLDIPIFDLFSALPKLNKKDEVIFIGWVRNRDFMGYGLMLKRYSVKAVCAVGAVEDEYSQYVLDRINRRYHISDKAPLFYLRGGFNPKLNRGSDRKIGSALIDDLAKKVTRSQKKNIQVDPYDQALLSALTRGGDFVSNDNLIKVIQWYNNN